MATIIATIGKKTSHEGDWRAGGRTGVECGAMSSDLARLARVAVAGMNGGGHSAEEPENGHEKDNAAADVIGGPAASGGSSQRTGGGGGQTGKDIMAMAKRVAAQPLPIARADLWGLLTAVSEKARKRPQGFHIILHSPEHVMGRNVKEPSCQFESPNVSGRHCSIARRLLGPNGKPTPFNHTPGPTDRVVICIRDSSSNGTFVNLIKLQRNGEEHQLRHGDIISLVGPPEHENAFAFVYREASAPMFVTAPLMAIPPMEAVGQPLKRKGSPPDDTGDSDNGDGKRIRGLGNGGVSGPTLLNDVRQLQRSNEELREQLESHMHEAEKLRSDNRSAEARHVLELKDLRATLLEDFNKQQEELRASLSIKEKELEASAALCVQQDSSIEVLKQRLASAAQSRVDAEEVIDSLKVRVQELEKLLEEERSKGSKERAEAEASLKASLERVRTEAAEELKRHDEAAARQQEQQNELILALQEADKEFRSAAEISRRKLDIERAAVVAAEERIRGLEAQLQEERNLTAIAHNRVSESEIKVQRACRELEVEKEARECAQIRVSEMEVKMEAATRDLKLEKQRLQGAMERIVLRESQLRAFHSSAAEYADTQQMQLELQQRQQELQQRQKNQLHIMLRTLEDGDSENYHHETDGRSTSPSTKVYPGPSGLGDRQNNKQTDETRGVSQSASGCRPMQVDTDAQSLHKVPSGKLVTKDIKLEDNQSSDTALDDSTDGDTQQDAASKPPVAIAGSSGGLVPPTQDLPPENLDGSLSDRQNPSPLNVQAGYTQLLIGDTGETGYMHNATADAGYTQLENADIGFTQLATADCGYTQLLDSGLPLKVPTASSSDREGVNRPCASAQERIGPTQEDEGIPTRMDEENEETQDPGKRTLDLFESRRNIGFPEERRVSIGTKDSNVRVRDSMCTADLFASEVAGSWAMATPASAHGENDSSSGEPAWEKAELRRISDEGAEFAASQVATNNVGGKTAEENTACNEGRNTNDVDIDLDVNADVDLSLSQTTPKANISSAEPQRVQEHQSLNEMTTVQAPSSSVRRRVATRNFDDTSSDSSSTEGGSREDGEIGASEFRESEPIYP